MKTLIGLMFIASWLFMTLANEALAQTQKVPTSPTVSRIEYTDSQLISFGFIWVALVVFSVGSMPKRKNKNKQESRGV